MVNREGVREYIRIYRVKRGLKWELRAANHEPLHRSEEPFKIGSDGLAGALRRIGASIRKARRAIIIAKVKVDL